MTTREFQIETERRLQMIDPQLAIENKLTSDDIFSILNEAIEKFWKTRYSGINYKQKGFEQDQKRTDDLRTLVKTATFTNDQIANESNVYKITLPSDYAILLGDSAGISPLDGAEMPCWEKDKNGNYIVKYDDTIESKVETIDRQLSNAFSEHKLKYTKARPLRLVKDNSVYLYTDGNYKVSNYTLIYLAKPAKLDINVNPTKEYTDLPTHTHMEIVKLAVQIYLSTKATNNYSQYSNEVATME